MSDAQSKIHILADLIRKLYENDSFDQDEKYQLLLMILDEFIINANGTSNDTNKKLTKEQIMNLCERIKELSSIPSVQISLKSSNSSLGMTKSKFGGYPYWTRGERFPKSDSGKQLFLLAQINFSEVPHIPDYPTSGLLQIFIANDHLFGCNCDAVQNNWRIIWRDSFTVSNAMTEAQLRKIGVKSIKDIKTDNNFPFTKEFELSFEKKQSNVVPRTYQSFIEFAKIAAKDLELELTEEEN